MVVVSLRSPLRDLAGGSPNVEVDGATVGEALRALERTHPRLTGWVLDERGLVREHVGVFVNGERASGESSVRPDDRIQVLPAISGGELRTMERPQTARAGADGDPAELLVGTKKGLYVLRGPRGGQMEIAGRRFEGNVVEFAMRDPRSGKYFASVTYGQCGARMY